MLRPKQIAQEGASFGEVLTWNGTTWAPARGRLVSTPSPAFGGSPGAFTYTLSGDEAIKFADLGPPGTFTVTMPSLLTVTPAQRVALYLPNGNPLTDIVFAIPAGPPSNMTDPTSPTEATTFPGSGVTIPSGTYTSPTWLEFEIVGVGAGEWRLVGDRSGSGGGAVGTWAATLAAGNDSGGESAYLNGSDAIVIGQSSGVVPTPGEWTNSSQSYRFARWFNESLVGSGGQATPVYLKSADVVTFSSGGPTPFNLPLVVDWTLFRLVSSTGFVPPTIQGIAHARQRVLLGLTSPITISPPMFSDIDQAGGNDIARLAQGSNNGSMAVEILDTPAPAGDQSVAYRLHLDVTGMTNVPGF